MFWLLLQGSLAGVPIDEIRGEWAAAETRITEGRMALLQVDWNATSMPWPAVGTYGHKLDVHYAQTGEAHYPETIVKLVVSRVTAARTETHSYLFAPDGTLRFAFATFGDTQVRVYWQGDRVLRVQVGDVRHDAPTGPQLDVATKLASEAAAAFSTARLLIDKPPPALALEDLEGRLEP